MALKEIKKLVQQGESTCIEFKRSTARLKSACQTICAFLNTDGGTVLIGVTDDQRLVGQEVADKTKREIGNELAKITPHANVEVNYVSLPNTDAKVITLHAITDSTKKPYMYDSRAFLRNQTETILMPDEYYRQLLLSNAEGKHAWDHQIAKGITLDDLDSEEILTTVKEGTLNGRIPKSYITEDPRFALRRLGLLEKDRITNAALVLFGKYSERKYAQCLLQLARFRGTDKSEFIDNKQINGNIFKLLDAAIAFANIHLPIASTFPKDQIKREDRPLFPITVLREAIANALCHRDYSSHSGSVSFAIFDDRIEIWDYGLFPHGVTLENLKTLNRSIPRNRKIANVLYYHKIFESWGRGIHMIIEGCKDAGHPEPSYTQDSVGTTLTLPLKRPIGSTLLPAQTTMDGGQLSERQQEIITILKQQGNLSTEQIRALMSNPPSDRWLRHELNELKALGMVDVRGKTTARKWFILN